MPRVTLDYSLGKRHNGVMKKVRISELRDHLSRYLDHVRAGGRVLVLDRERPVAEIVPVSPLRRDNGIDDARLAALERQGLISCATGPIPPSCSGRPRWGGERSSCKPYWTSEPPVDEALGQLGHRALDRGSVDLPSASFSGGIPAAPGEATPESACAPQPASHAERLRPVERGRRDRRYRTPGRKGAPGQPP
jgi:prevent-host-death family protein